MEAGWCGVLLPAPIFPPAFLFCIDNDATLAHNLQFVSEGFPSGQRDQTVNLTALPSKVRILPPPPKVYAVSLRLVSGGGAGGSG